MLVRVRDYLYDSEDNQQLHPETGQPLRNNIAYLYQRKAHLPGSTFEMDDRDAEDAVKRWASRRGGIETAQAHKERMARIEARAQQKRDEERDVFAREMDRLDRQAAHAARTRQLLHEQELARALQQAPGAATRMVIERFQEASAQAQDQITKARDEVPPAILEQLAQLAARLNAAEEKSAARIAELEAQLAGSKAAPPVFEVKPESKPSDKSDRASAKK